MIEKVHKFIFGNCTEREYVSAFLIAVLLGISIGETIYLISR